MRLETATEDETMNSEAFENHERKSIPYKLVDMAEKGANVEEHIEE